MHPSNRDIHDSRPEVAGQSGYRLVYHLGHGGMGEVFEAGRDIDGQEYRSACKTMRPDLMNAPAPDTEHRTEIDTSGRAFRSRRRWIGLDVVPVAVLVFLVFGPLVFEPEGARQAVVSQHRASQNEPRTDRDMDKAESEPEEPTPTTAEEIWPMDTRKIVTRRTTVERPAPPPGPSRNLAIQKTEPEPAVITPPVTNPWIIIQTQQPIPSEPDDPVNPTVYYFDLPLSPMRGKREAQQVKSPRAGTTSRGTP